MIICASNLGFRELTRLISFIKLMMDNYPDELKDCIIRYSFMNDEPEIARTPESLFASDFDIAFDAHNNAEFI